MLAVGTTDVQMIGNNHNS